MPAICQPHPTCRVHLVPRPQFWETPEIIALIESLKYRNPEKKEVDKAWAAILKHYFKTHLPRGKPHSYSVATKPFDGLLRTGKADVVVVTRETPFKSQLLGLPNTHRREILWVASQPGSSRDPRRWKTLIENTAERLQEAHPHDTLYVIICIDLKWMPFTWKPYVGHLASSLTVVAANRLDIWRMDHRLRCDDTLPGKRHVLDPVDSLSNRRISPPDAYSLKDSSDVKVLQECLDHFEKKKFKWVNG